MKNGLFHRNCRPQDATKAAEYRKEVRTAQKKLKAFVDENGDALRRDYWRERYDGLPLQEERAWIAGGTEAGKRSFVYIQNQSYLPDEWKICGWRL